MDLYDLVKKKAPEIIKLADQHGAENIRLFGSVARRESDEKSDIDFLVDYDRKKRSSWFPMSLVNELQDLLGTRVDVLTSHKNSRFKARDFGEVILLSDLIKKD